MFRNVIIGLVSAITVFLTWVAMQPGTYAVSRSVTIAAPPTAVYPHLASLKKFDRWSPWASKDPAMKKDYGGPESGTGATYTWKGNHEVGSGTMTITQARPDEHVGIRLDFTEPMAGTSVSVFDLKPDAAGAGTNVTWSISGENGFVARVFMAAMGIKLEKMIGADYEKGLASLKALVETAPKS